MKGSVLMLAAIGAMTALWLAAPLAAGSGAGKTVIQIDAVSEGAQSYSGSFTLERLKGPDYTLVVTGSRDRGTVTGGASSGADRRTPDGQLYDPVKGTDTLKGKAGSLVLRWRGRIYDVAGPHAASGAVEAWLGTWSIVRGTGKYAGLKGRGRYAGIVKVCCKFTRRYAGYVASS